jgi:hypothetical protein
MGVKMIGTGAPGAKYRTRRLLAGDEIEVGASEARFYRAAKWATDAPPKRGPGRPRKELAPAPEPVASSKEPEPAKDDLDELTNAELMQRANDRSIELPPGYITNEDLIARLRA